MNGLLARRNKTNLGLTVSVTVEDVPDCRAKGTVSRGGQTDAPFVSWLSSLLRECSLNTNGKIIRHEPGKRECAR